jgi:hypothetical protein
LNAAVNDPPENPTRLRWLHSFSRCRFSLRTLLVVVTGISLALGFLGESARRQRRLIDTVEALRGTVGYATLFDSDPKYNRSPKSLVPQWVSSVISPDYYARVADVRMGRSIQLMGPGVIDELASRLAAIPALHHLSLSGFELSDDEYMAIAIDARPKEITFVNVELNDAAATTLSNVTSLCDLGLNDVRISAQGISGLRRLPNLEHFWLSSLHSRYDDRGESLWRNWAIGDETVPVFLEFPKLRRLSLHNTLITDEGVEQLTRLDLKSFEISSPNVTNAAMASIVRCKNLGWLCVSGTQIDDDALPRLQELPHLKGFAGMRAMTNEGLRHLAKLKGLESLRLSGDLIDDAGLVHLHGMKKLQRLDLQSTAVQSTTVAPRSAAVKALQSALPDCTIQQPRRSMRRYFYSGSPPASAAVGSAAN